MISYEPLWETMKRKKVTTYQLIYKHNLSSNTIRRIRQNKGINTTSTLNDLCRILDCTVSEILEYIPDEKSPLSEETGEKKS